MRPARRFRLLPLAIVLALAAGACSAATPSSGVTTTTVPSAPASQAADASVAPSMAPSPSDSAPPSATPSPTAAPTPTSTPGPTARPTPTASPKASSYLCTKLLTDAEMRSATGLKDAALEGHKNGRARVEGETYCGFTASGGTVRIVVAVWTGPAMPSFEEFWGVILPRSSPVDGIGSAAIIDSGDGNGGARVKSLGLSVQIFGPNGVPAGLNALTSITKILTVVSKRV